MLNLTKSERHALLLISGIVLISVIIKWIQPHEVRTGLFDYSLEDSLFKALSEPAPKADSVQKGILLSAEKSTSKKTGAKLLKEKSINLNSATQHDLEQLPRIGPATAKAIVEYRQLHGLFKSIQDLEKVKRIGPKTVELIAPYVYISSDTTK